MESPEATPESPIATRATEMVFAFLTALRNSANINFLAI
jgi:hypothetical protein